MYRYSTLYCTTNVVSYDQASYEGSYHTKVLSYEGTVRVAISHPGKTVHVQYVYVGALLYVYSVYLITKRLSSNPSGQNV